MVSLPIGIDLGSHSTKVGYIDRTGQFRLIYQMRSIFAFDQDENEEPTFGQDALEADYNKIIADANRDQKFEARHGQANPPSGHAVPFCCYAKYDWQKQGSYDLMLNGSPMSDGGDAEKTTTFVAGQQAIIASILAHLKAQLVKQKLLATNQECHAIIAVPTFAGDNHRRIILEAAQLAGCFHSVQLLSQTTAAFIAYTWTQQQAQRDEEKYGSTNKYNTRGNCQKQANEQQQLSGLICFGASSFECSLFHAFDANSGSFIPKLVATAGTSAFGSASFTDELALWCLAKLDPDGNNLGRNVRRQIWEECEEAKQRLSRSESTRVALHYHDKEKGLKNVNGEVQRSVFERQCQQLLNQLGLVIERAFGPSRGKIGRLLLFGEGWRMPAFMQLVEPYLAKNCVKVEGNNATAPGEWVVKGTAVKAGAMESRRRQKGNKSTSFEDLLYRQVKLAFPMPKGGGRVLVNLFQPNMQIPTDQSERFECKGGSVEILLEEDALQMTKIIVPERTDGFNQIAFHIGLNGLLQARLYNFLDQAKDFELLPHGNWSNLYGNDCLLNSLREELTKLSILPRANAASSNDWDEKEKGGGEDKSAPNIDRKIDELIKLMDKTKEPVGAQESGSTRSYANVTKRQTSQRNEEVRKNEENLPALAPATSSSSSSGMEMKVSSQLAQKFYLHSRDVMEDIEKLSSLKAYNFDNCLRKLHDIYAKLSKSYGESWPLYMDFLAEAETVRAKHWAYQNSQRVLQIVRDNQWEAGWIPIRQPPFHHKFMSYRLGGDFLRNLAECADHGLVNVIYEAFVNEIRKELKHGNFKEHGELVRLMEDKYTCHYQQIAYE